VVVFKGWQGGFGNTLKIRHSNSSYASSYGHLSGFVKGIGVGKHVSQGQMIGYVGSTGMSTGPHLDFRFEQGGRFVNFLGIKMPAHKNLTSKQDLAEFARAREFVTAKLEALPKEGKGIFPIR
jgi:murein DD-endopeptidase MepM/ murein hydrolase activator NlpD